MAGNFLGTKTFSSASAAGDISTFQKINIAPTRDRQARRTSGAFFATCAGSGGTPSGTAILQLALTDGAVVYARRSITLTVQTTRTGPDGASGDYNCKLEEEQTGRHVADLAGLEPPDKGGGALELYWMIGLISHSITNFGSITVNWTGEPA